MSESPHEKPSTRIDGTVHAGAVYGGTVTGVYVNGDSITTYNNYSSEIPSSVSAPYKFLLPYLSDGDKWIFKGREEETRAICRTANERSVIVVWGRAGIGKTSVICAGVLPKLSSSRVVRLTSYENPLEFLRKAFLKPDGKPPSTEPGPDNASDTRAKTEEASPTELEIPAGESLPQMIARVTAHSKMRVVIILDQFELLFRDATSPEIRVKFIQELAAALETKTPDFRLFIVVDEAEIGQVVELQNTSWPPGLEIAHVQIKALREDQAEAAIVEPRKAVNSEVRLDLEVVKLMLEDLVSMGPGDSGRQESSEDKGIYPPYLQIVCHTLYEMAKSMEDPRISVDLYSKAGRGQGIFATYLDGAIRNYSQDDGEHARQVLEKMAEPEIKGWIHPEKLGLNWTAEPAGMDVFQKLVDARLVSVRKLNEQREYALPNPAVVKAIRSRWGLQVQKQVVAREEFEHAYSSWLARKEGGEQFASRSQLRLIGGYARYLKYEAVNGLLLLRSACEYHEPTGIWLEMLKDDGAKSLINILETSTGTDSASTEITNAKLLLGMANDTELENPPKEQSDFLTLSRAAVRHPQKKVRETAAVALMAIGNGTAIGNLEAAFPLESVKGWTQWMRRIELRAAMADADPLIAGLGGQPDRLLIFLLMLWRNAYYRDGVRIVRLVIGGALGAGLALGVTGGAIAKLVGKNAFFQVSNQFFYGCIFGGMMAAAIGISKPLTRTFVQGHTPGKRSLDLSPTTWALLLGTLAFGLTHTFIHGMAGEGQSDFARGSSLITLGFVAGLGVSWALRGYSQNDTDPPPVWRFKPLFIAAFSFFVVQLVFSLFSFRSPRNIQALLIAVTPGTYSSGLPNTMSPAFYQYLQTTIPRWSIYLSMLGSAMTGLFLAAGMRYGLRKAIWSLKQNSDSILTRR